MGRICSNCGFELNDNYKFCPICGSEISDDGPQREKYKFCPKCGSKIRKNIETCPNCGINFNGIFRKIANKYANAKSVNKFLEWGASTAWKSDTDLMSNRLIKKSWELDDPAFLIVYETIVGDYLKKLFLLERIKILVGDSTPILGNIKFTPPTQNWPLDKSIKFYEELLENVISELNEAKQKENFNKEEYFRKKYKESQIELFANYPL